MSVDHRQGMGFVSAVCMTLMLAACGGGSGSSSSDSGTGTTKAISLSGAQENPAVTTAATGNGFIIVDDATGAVKGTITTFGISGSAAHIHEAAPGVNGGIIVELTQGEPGVWTVPDGAALSQSQVASFKAGNLYVNVHTTANPNGEIRGQVGRDVYFATLTGAQEVPANNSQATGTARFVFDPDTKAMFGTVSTSGIVGTASHIHTGAIGVAAGITIPFTGGPSSWTMPSTVLTDAQVASLQSGNFYANVHSAAIPGGEIRGQVYLPAKCTTLAGNQEVPPVATAATAHGCLVVNPFTRGVAGRIETDGIIGTLAHAHTGAIGVAGPVRIPMTSPSAGVWVTAPGAAIGDADFASFMKGEMYLNVHSSANPLGEIRGQLVTGQ